MFRIVQINIIFTKIDATKMARFIIGLLLFTAISLADTPNLFINEFLSSNASSNLDPDFFSFCDWIEIYNSEDTVVQIGGYYITDDLSNPLKPPCISNV